MANSYMIVIMDSSGRVQAQERRTFSREVVDSWIHVFPDDSIADHDALVLVNDWNRKAAQQAYAGGFPVRFMYYL